MFIDIHTHLPQYDDVELDEIVSRWRLNDVKYVVSTGTTIDDSERSIDLSKRYNDVLAGIGIHPSDLTQNWKEDLSKIKKLSDNNLSMISEIGLDYQEISPDKAIQIQAFEFQINLAIEKKIANCISYKKRNG